MASPSKPLVATIKAIVFEYKNSNFITYGKEVSFNFIQENSNMLSKAYEILPLRSPGEVQCLCVRLIHILVYI